jgi:hypothetical protein
MSRDPYRYLGDISFTWEKTFDNQSRKNLSKDGEVFRLDFGLSLPLYFSPDSH